MKISLLISLAVILFCGCSTQTPLAKFQKLCEKTGGVFLDCAVAFAQICSEPTNLEGRQVVCSCLEGRLWDPDKGCR
ncbi:MAG TPA: hypothetical protein VI749_03320 [Candidatus Omnitrophota bacterium]|nr:hypothetical protein [Candidatus Omnitrophota bacterium]